ncbi:helix-turn-helix transcriptional regulator [Streptomyces griseofuscus]|uniref:HTH cro/C1-type domain-containing protein n=1 Tax=Streptomyces griseofuscus TaxID=146922 RepID=A0A7H1Q3F9_9ACTN|nr:helix-turn-helix transcriptional regulator [Streptomyces griseofuscus]QNT94839.1 hypothetical protein HEP81_04566 [Streptomyces griseofuscus]
MSRPRLHTQALEKKTEKVGDDTARKIAQRIGVAESTISRLLAGATPTVETLIALSDAYGLRIEDLVIRSDGTPLRVPGQAAPEAVPA